MIRRLFYMALGAALGIYAMRRVERARQAWTPQGVAARATGQAAALGERMKAFADDVRTAADARAGELRVARDKAARDGAPTEPVDNDMKDGH